MSLDGITANQIDHICINLKFKRSLCDIRVRRSADAASDHHLLTASVKLKLKRFHRPRNSRTRFNVHLLKDPLVPKEFNIKLSNRFQALQDLNGATPEDARESNKTAWTENCKEFIGFHKSNHKDWMSMDTFMAVA